ncbi:MAG TPA: hypothetical protein PKH93_12230, partial [Chitinophagales bacterium]|nr:hypothetical protein [Chitinophagales bacterium]
HLEDHVGALSSAGVDDGLGQITTTRVQRGVGAEARRQLALRLGGFVTKLSFFEFCVTFSPFAPLLIGV